MAGSIRLYWKERLPDNDIHAIMESVELFEVFDIDEDELREELQDTELMPDEIETIIEDYR